MKNDLISSAIINFLVPIIFLYGLFFLADFIDEGFSAIIYSLVLFIAGLMIFLVNYSPEKSPNLAILEPLSFFILFLAIGYIFSILVLITNLFSM